MAVFRVRPLQVVTVEAEFMPEISAELPDSGLPYVLSTKRNRTGSSGRHAKRRQIRRRPLLKICAGTSITALRNV